MRGGLESGADAALVRSLCLSIPWSSAESPTNEILPEVDGRDATRSEAPVCLSVFLSRNLTSHKKTRRFFPPPNLPAPLLLPFSFGLVPLHSICLQQCLSSHFKMEAVITRSELF